MTIDRTNRFLLGLLGLLLLAAGVLGLSADDDPFDLGVDQPGEIYQDARDGVVDHAWLWAVIIGGSALIVVLSVIWIRAQFVRRGGRGLGTTLLTRSSQGETTLEPAGVAHAFAADLRTIDGVRDSSARIVDVDPVTDVIARLELERGVEVDRIEHEVEEAITRLRAALGSDAVDVELRLIMATEDAPRVV